MDDSCLAFYCPPKPTNFPYLSLGCPLLHFEHIHVRLRPSVRPSVRSSVRPSVRPPHLLLPSLLVELATAKLSEACPVTRARAIYLSISRRLLSRGPSFLPSFLPSLLRDAEQDCLTVNRCPSVRRSVPYMPTTVTATDSACMPRANHEFMMQIKQTRC